MVVDPQNSVFLDYWQSRNADLRSPVGSKMKGIGRPRVEPSFIPDVVDEMLRVPDAASVATAHWLETQLGLGGCLYRYQYVGALQLAARMREEGRTGSIVTLLCDSGSATRNLLQRGVGAGKHRRYCAVESAHCTAGEIKARPKSGLLEESHYSGNMGVCCCPANVLKWDTASLRQCPITGR